VTTDDKLRAILAAVQRDVGNRGLARLFEAFPDDFAAACRSLAGATSLGVVTGFWIPSVRLPETDGPLGAVYLARTLDTLGIRVHLISDPFCRPAHEAGLLACGRLDSTRLHDVGDELPPLSHLLALERVGPNQHGRCHTMRGIDITDAMRDAAALFEASGGRQSPGGRDATDRGVNTPRSPGAVTFGIGDGGNEIGMGKLPWELIRDNVPNGGVIACRVPTDFLIVAGISNWGAYALAAGVAVVKGVAPPDDWFDVGLERRILREMVEKGPLVDGVTGRAEDSVDGLPFERYIEPLTEIQRIVRG
jgi:D-glutamate cyclase